ncbi:MAG: NAD-binding protein [Gammaproteobacteria bacterium]|nr:NAD-binding protein [Gammaproteobacteria bacterium]MBU1653300.1 NAD-binding protein [Gammaproteobacteria bacterium]MBU1962440.1 NAD-binding protein [Gammaproteobacteria bacterium]
MPDNIIFIVLRRMRVPLLALILAYAVAVLGFALIPGQGPDGSPQSMSFLHAFYVVSYTATTIGLGEIPYAFTDAQRLWLILTIYLTVIVWVYSIGALLALVQEATFRQVLAERAFVRRVKRLHDPFLLICGYGDTGEALVTALLERGQQAVVLDTLEERLNALRLQNLPLYVPALIADARRPGNLLKAGLKHPLCVGVAALTSDNEANLKVAITGKLLHPEAKVICRADSQEVEVNMASFGTDHIIDPFATFSIHLAKALQAPCLHLLHEWLTSARESPLREPIFPPHRGVWVLCGYGRFGKSIYRRLHEEGIEVIVVEATPEITGMPREGCVVGRGTEAATLSEAQIERAAGLVAGTDNDVNNLSIVMTAKGLNPDLFVIARQNSQDNRELFEAVNADILMHPSSIIANRIRVLLAAPLLYEFESLALHQPDDWACQLVSRIAALVNERAPEVWEVALDAEGAHAVHRALEAGRSVRLGDILKAPDHPQRQLGVIPLLLIRPRERLLLPPNDLKLHLGDKLLFCAAKGMRDLMEWTLQNEHSLEYVMTGDRLPQGYLWRALQGRRHSPKLR